MTREAFKALFNAAPVILDGATGSNLRAAGMPVGVCTEAWILEHPETLKKLQCAYAEAGSQIIYAPTFGANRFTLAMYGMEDRVEEMNRRLVALSLEAVDGRALVAGDITTTGKPVGAEGAPGYEELLDIYGQQAQAQLEAGVELFAIETMLGVTECSAAIEAVRSICDLPILCTMTLDAVGGAYFDGDAEQAAQQLPMLGADAVGVNCGQGPELYEGVILRMAEASEVPLIAKPNAGLPVMQPDGTALYSMSPGRFARSMLRLKDCGARLLGGCCGTTPEHIAMLRTICG